MMTLPDPTGKDADQDKPKHYPVEVYRDPTKKPEQPASKPSPTEDPEKVKAREKKRLRDNERLDQLSSRIGEAISPRHNIHAGMRNAFGNNVVTNMMSAGVDFVGDKMKEALFGADDGGADSESPLAVAKRTNKLLEELIGATKENGDKIDHLSLGEKAETQREQTKEKTDGVVGDTKKGKPEPPKKTDLLQSPKKEKEYDEVFRVYPEEKKPEPEIIPPERRIKHDNFIDVEAREVKESEKIKAEPVDSPIEPLVKKHHFPDHNVIDVEAKEIKDPAHIHQHPHPVVETPSKKYAPDDAKVKRDSTPLTPKDETVSKNIIHLLTSINDNIKKIGEEDKKSGGGHEGMEMPGKDISLGHIEKPTTSKTPAPSQPKAPAGKIPVPSKVQKAIGGESIRKSVTTVAEKLTKPVAKLGGTAAKLGLSAVLGIATKGKLGGITGAAGKSMLSTIAKAAPAAAPRVATTAASAMPIKNAVNSLSKPPAAMKGEAPKGNALDDVLNKGQEAQAEPSEEDPSGALSSIAGAIPGLLGGAKGAGKVLGKIAPIASKALKFLPAVGAALTVADAGYSAFKGYNDAENIMDTNGREATTGEKISAGAGGAINSLSFGLLDKKASAKFIHSAGEKIGSMFSSDSDDKAAGLEQKEKEVKDAMAAKTETKDTKAAAPVVNNIVTNNQNFSPERKPVFNAEPSFNRYLKTSY